jgi:hypothetical protein
MSIVVSERAAFSVSQNIQIDQILICQPTLLGVSDIVN